jgi:hypothetical protein
VVIVKSTISSGEWRGKSRIQLYVGSFFFVFFQFFFPQTEPCRLQLQPQPGAGTQSGEARAPPQGRGGPAARPRGPGLRPTPNTGGSPDTGAEPQPKTSSPDPGTEARHQSRSPDPGTKVEPRPRQLVRDQDQPQASMVHF